MQAQSSSSRSKTVFGSLDSFEKGKIELIHDRRENYTFSNVFEVASQSMPYEKVVVGKNLKYVIETLRAEGESSWFAASHDEFALVMDGEIRIDLVKLAEPDVVAPKGVEGSIKLDGEPRGRPMGHMILRRGHQALLPVGAAYRFTAIGRAGVIVLQTILGEHSVQKWSEICLT
jgi:hypothetical protein